MAFDIQKYKNTFGPNKGLMHRQWTVEEGQAIVDEVQRLMDKEIQLGKIIGEHVDHGEKQLKEIESLKQQLAEAKKEAENNLADLMNLQGYDEGMNIKEIDDE